MFKMNYRKLVAVLVLMTMLFTFVPTNAVATVGADVDSVSIVMTDLDGNPITSVSSIGAEFFIKVVTSQVSQLVGASVKLRYDPAKLEVKDADTVEDGVQPVAVSTITVGELEYQQMQSPFDDISIGNSAPSNGEFGLVALNTADNGTGLVKFDASNTAPKDFSNGALLFKAKFRVKGSMGQGTVVSFDSDNGLQIAGAPAMLGENPVPIVPAEVNVLNIKTTNPLQDVLIEGMSLSSSERNSFADILSRTTTNTLEACVADMKGILTQMPENDIREALNTYAQYPDANKDDVELSVRMFSIPAEIVNKSAFADIAVMINYEVAGDANDDRGLKFMQETLSRVCVIINSPIVFDDSADAAKIDFRLDKPYLISKIDSLIQAMSIMDPIKEGGSNNFDEFLANLETKINAKPTSQIAAFKKFLDMKNDLVYSNVIPSPTPTPSVGSNISLTISLNELWGGQVGGGWIPPAGNEYYVKVRTAPGGFGDTIKNWKIWLTYDASKIEIIDADNDPNNGLTPVDANDSELFIKNTITENIAYNNVIKFSVDANDAAEFMSGAILMKFKVKIKEGIASGTSIRFSKAEIAGETGEGFSYMFANQTLNNYILAPNYDNIQIASVPPALSELKQIDGKYYADNFDVVISGLAGFLDSGAEVLLKDDRYGKVFRPTRVVEDENNAGNVIATFSKVSVGYYYIETRVKDGDKTHTRQFNWDQVKIRINSFENKPVLIRMNPPFIVADQNRMQLYYEGYNLQNIGGEGAYAVLKDSNNTIVATTERDPQQPGDTWLGFETNTWDGNWVRVNMRSIGEKLVAGIYRLEIYDEGDWDPAVGFRSKLTDPTKMSSEVIVSNDFYLDSWSDPWSFGFGATKFRIRIGALNIPKDLIGSQLKVQLVDMNNVTKKWTSSSVELKRDMYDRRRGEVIGYFNLTGNPLPNDYTDIGVYVKITEGETERDVLRSVDIVKQMINYPNIWGAETNRYKTGLASYTQTIYGWNLDPTKVKVEFYSGNVGKVRGQNVINSVTSSSINVTFTPETPSHIVDGSYYFRVTQKEDWGDWNLGDAWFEIRTPQPWIGIQGIGGAEYDELFREGNTIEIPIAVRDVVLVSPYSNLDIFLKGSWSGNIAPSELKVSGNEQEGYLVRAVFTNMQVDNYEMNAKIKGEDDTIISESRWWFDIKPAENSKPTITNMNPKSIQAGSQWFNLGLGGYMLNKLKDSGVPDSPKKVRARLVDIGDPAITSDDKIVAITPDQDWNVWIADDGRWMNLNMMAVKWDPVNRRVVADESGNIMNNEKGISVGRYKLEITSDGLLWVTNTQSPYYSTRGIVYKFSSDGKVGVIDTLFLEGWADPWSLGKGITKFTTRFRASNLQKADLTKINVKLKNQDTGAEWTANTISVERDMYDPMRGWLIAEFDNSSKPLPSSNTSLKYTVTDSSGGSPIDIPGSESLWVQVVEYPTLYSVEVPDPRPGIAEYNLIVKGWNLPGNVIIKVKDNNWTEVPGELTYTIVDANGSPTTDGNGAKINISFKPTTSLAEGGYNIEVVGQDGSNFGSMWWNVWRPYIPEPRIWFTDIPWNQLSETETGPATIVMKMETENVFDISAENINEKLKAVLRGTKGDIIGEATDLTISPNGRNQIKITFTGVGVGEYEVIVTLNTVKKTFAGEEEPAVAQERNRIYVKAYYDETVFTGVYEKCIPAGFNFAHLTIETYKFNALGNNPMERLKVELKKDGVVIASAAGPKNMSGPAGQFAPGLEFNGDWNNLGRLGVDFMTAPGTTIAAGEYDVAIYAKNALGEYDEPLAASQNRIGKVKFTSDMFVYSYVEPGVLGAGYTGGFDLILEANNLSSSVTGNNIIVKLTGEDTTTIMTSDNVTIERKMTGDIFGRIIAHFDDNIPVKIQPYKVDVTYNGQDVKGDENIWVKVTDRTEFYKAQGDEENSSPGKTSYTIDLKGWNVKADNTYRIEMWGEGMSVAMKSCEVVYKDETTLTATFTLYNALKEGRYEIEVIDNNYCRYGRIGWEVHYKQYEEMVILPDLVGKSILKKPETATEVTTSVYKIILKDEMGNIVPIQMPPEMVNLIVWKIKPATEGESTGGITVVGSGLEATVSITNAVAIYNFILRVEGPEYNPEYNDPTTFLEMPIEIVSELTPSVASKIKILGIKSGEEILPGETVAKPSTGTSAVQYAAAVYDQYGNEMPGEPIKWGLASPVVGIKVNTDEVIGTATGTVSIDSAVTASSFTLVAASVNNPLVKEKLLVTTGKTGGIVTKIEVTGGSSIRIPTQGSTTSTYKAKITDQYGDEMLSETAAWSLDSTLTGVSINATTGVVTVTSSAEEGKTFKVIATSTTDKTKTADISVTLKKETPVATSIEIVGKDTIEKPVSGSTAVTYEAIVRDQYNAKMTGQTINWTMPVKLSGVEFDATTPGKVIVNSSVNPGTFEMKIELSTNTALNAKKQVSIVNAQAVIATIEISGADSIKKPGTGTDTASYSATVKDQYGQTMTSEAVTWSIDTTDSKISIDSSKGIITITDLPSVSSVVLTATSKTNTQKTAQKTISLTEPAVINVVTSLSITGEASIKIPTSDTVNSVSYIATAKDQFGQEMNDETFTWSIVGGEPTGVEIEANSNGINIKVSKTALKQDITLKAVSNSDLSVYAEKIISLTEAGLIVSSVTGNSGDTVDVSVTVQDVKNLLTAEFTITYNPDIAVVAEITAGSFVTDNGYMLVSSKKDATNGQVTIAIAGSTEFSGSGELFKLKLLIGGELGNSTEVAASSLRIGDEQDNVIPVTVTNGLITIGSTIIYGDVSGEGNVTSYDAARILQHIVGLKPFTAPQQLVAGDVSGDGKVTSFDAAKVLQRVVGLITKFPIENK